MAVPARFVQPVADLPDAWQVDRVLRDHLRRLLGDDGAAAAADVVRPLAAECSRSLRSAAREAEQHPPVLRSHDGWGRRIDEVVTGAGWEAQRRAAARHGLVSLPYEDRSRQTWGAGARVVQHALVHVWAPDSAIFSCPVAMSDGAARVLGGPDVEPALRDDLLPRLLSRDPEVAWTSGQWMTETTGGSDVGLATTTARPVDGGWELTGEKWFCSATTAEVAVALARPEGAAGGTAGLACFVVPRYGPGRSPSGLRPTAEGLRLHRLKDKLGTRALPSAEVQLDGARAWPLGDPCSPGGLRRMMELVVVTRLHNAANAAALLRRGLVMARTYAQTRVAFDRPLWQQPAHREVLAGLAVDAAAAHALALVCFEALGHVELATDRAEEAAALLRIATTLAKSATARLAVAGTSEVIECFGGPGYVEDTGVPVLLRDAQVLPVWEGTTTIQALDLLRCLADPRVDALGALERRVTAAGAAAAASHPDLARLVADLAEPQAALLARTRQAGADPEAPTVQAGARHLTDALAALLAAAVMLELATFGVAEGDLAHARTAELWVRRRLLGEPCLGWGDRWFAAVVDGEPVALTSARPAT